MCGVVTRTNHEGTSPGGTKESTALWNGFLSGTSVKTWLVMDEGEIFHESTTSPNLRLRISELQSQT